MTVLDVIKLHGGYWGHHPKYLISDWQYEVSNGDTRTSYWSWVLAHIEEEEHYHESLSKQ